MNAQLENLSDLSRTVRIQLGGEAEPFSSPNPTEPDPERAPLADADELKEYALLDSVYDAALITNLDGILVAANARACTFFQYARADMRGQVIGQLLAGVTSDLLARLRTHLERNRFVLIQCFGIRKNRTAFPAEVAANHLRHPDDRICFMVRDISLRKQTEDLLQTVNLAMKNAPIGIAAITTVGRIQYANPAFAQVFGLEPGAEPIGLPFADLVAESDRAHNMLREVMDGQREWTGEMNARRPDGGPLPIRVTANCNWDSEGSVSGAVLSVVDLTDSKRSEELLRTTVRQEAMLASLSAACHHLAQPATVILGHLDMLIHELETASHAHILAREAADAAHQLAGLLHKLNRVEDFRTLPYLSNSASSDPENRILRV